MIEPTVPTERDGFKAPSGSGRIRETNFLYQGTTSVVPPVGLGRPFGFSRSIPQGLKALAIIGALGSGTPEGVP